MATRFSNALHPSYTPVANFRANAQFVEDTLVATGGWVVTADTGQTTPATLPIPPGANQRMGYRVYAMTDALSATYPVVMRVDYGSSQFSGQAFKFWVTIGMGSDGAGNITNKLIDLFGLVALTNVSDPVGVTNSYGSAGPGRVAICLFVQAGGVNQILFCLERSKDATGQDTGDGLLLSGTNGVASSFDVTQYLIYGMTTQPATELGLSYILTTQNPSQSLGAAVGVGVLSHFKGIAQQPGINAIVVNSADVPSEGVFLLSIYGVTHTYQQLGSLFTERALANSQHYSDTGTRVAMRYD